MELKKLVTIVIPCKNENKLIGNLLENLNNQRNIKDTKVFVADSSDDFTTIHYISSQKNKEISLEIINGGYPAFARHNGAIKSKTPYILFLDSDMSIESQSFINDILDEIIKKEGTLLTCKVRSTENKFNIYFKVFDFIQKLHWVTKPFALGGIMLFNTKDYFYIGGFNPDDLFAEDYNLSKKVKSNKFILSKKIIKTSPRRFKNKSILYIVKMMFLSFIHRNNKSFFKKSHNYWS